MIAVLEKGRYGGLNAYAAAPDHSQKVVYYVPVTWSTPQASDEKAK